MTRSADDQPITVRRFGPPGPGTGGGVRIERARSARGALARLLGYLSPYRTVLVLTFALVALSTVLTLAGPYLLGRAIDGFTKGGSKAGLLRTVELMAAAYLGLGLAQAAQSVIMARVGQRALRVLRQDLFVHLQTLSLSFFDRRPIGDLMSRLTNDIETINLLLTTNATQTATSVLNLVGVVVMMFALDVRLALGTLLVLPLMVGLALLVGQRTRRGFRTQQRRVGNLSGVMEEAISGQRVVQAFGQQAAALATFDQANAAARDASIAAQSFALLIPPMMTVLTDADIAVVAGIGGWLVLLGYASVGTIATFANYARVFAQPLRTLADMYNQIQAALAGAERVFEITDTVPEIRDAPDAEPLGKIQGHVEFDHVNFSYLRDVPVLMDINLEAQPGQTIALVGPTGAGKTTIVNLLTRFYDIESGAIRIDGHDIRSVTQDSLRRQLGIVLQDNYLFANTVMENIRYGRLEATDDECIAAAQLANADQFITRLPQGYATVLSERASNLSQGQRQLLAIALAVLADPRILVLDEATSSVDTRTEMHIQEALLRLLQGRTAFVIAHRLSTIREADLVLVINEGRIIERGTHDELLAQQGFYYRLYRSQFREN
jgi:ATP-binding cassette subfamily B multidrug efflux pump